MHCASKVVRIAEITWYENDYYTVTSEVGLHVTKFHSGMGMSGYEDVCLTEHLRRPPCLKNDTKGDGLSGTCSRIELAFPLLPPFISKSDGVRNGCGTRREMVLQLPFRKNR